MNDLTGLALLLGDEAAEPSERLIADDESREKGGLAVGNNSLLLDLLDLRGVDLENVVATLDALVQGQVDEALGIGVDVGGGLLDGRETLVKAGEGGIAERVGLGDVRRDVLVGLEEEWDDGGGKGLVGGVGQGNGALAILVGLEGLDAIADEGVVEKVLSWNRELASKPLGNTRLS